MYGCNTAPIALYHMFAAVSAAGSERILDEARSLVKRAIRDNAAWTECQFICQARHMVLFSKIT